MRRAGARNKKPCADFDPSEKQMGRCKTCGFSLAEHLRPEGAETDEAAAALREAEEEERKAASAPKAPPPALPKRACKNFTLVVDGSARPMCTCGFPKDQHKGDDKTRSKRFSFMALKKTLTRKNKAGKELPPEPCDQYRVDLESDQYGLCFCGFNKLDHEKAAAKRQAAADAEAEKKRGMQSNKKKPTQPCGNFELDLTNTGGYGECKHCGFKRDAHKDFHVKPEGWDEVKLTEPKPFD